MFLRADKRELQEREKCIQFTIRYSSLTTCAAKEKKREPNVKLRVWKRKERNSDAKEN
jgi:hypothetical protein